MLIKRRNFIQAGSLATGTLMVPQFLKAFEKPQMVPGGHKAVVVIQLSGGNDGLNTVIPYRNDVYYRERPGLGIKREDALAITDEAGLHPSLAHFRALHDAGNLAILNSVGYPNPDRSHFRSMDIWQSASRSNEILDTGWIGRYLDAQCAGCDKPTQAIEVDDVLSLAMKGKLEKGLAFRNPRNLYGSSQEKYFRELVNVHGTAKGNSQGDYLYKTMADTISSADYIYQQSRLHPSSLQYPSSQLGQSLKTIAGLIFSEINTRVYYVSLGSFDTHIMQEGQQKRLFTELNDAVQAFTTDLKANHRMDDVLIFTFSEFGRRVSQNASGGTDHGTANNMFLISSGLKKKGLINQMPDLQNLQDGDLKYSVDFKSVYATILRNWLDADDTAILGSKNAYLDFI
jgi:uncharacterized protein (DUF1501 family)